jgi:hypothetical protein
MKRPPNVIKAYDSLPRNSKYPLQEFRLRIVKYHNSTILLDIREYITSDEFTGYSPKGTSLNKEQVLYLAAQMHDILSHMKEEKPNPNQLKLPLSTPLVIKLAENVKVVSMQEDNSNEDNS